jgi:hypothetical protein
MRPLARRSALLALLLLLPLLGGCAGLRSTFRGWSNADMVGREAPPLTDGEWILPSDLDAEDVELADWRLVAIFKPT